MASYEIRPMTLEELESTAVEWAAREGWNPGFSDAGGFFAADPGGFLLGLLDGEPIASISAVTWGPAFGFVGFYIVRPEFRGRGYGLAIWKRAMERLEGRNVGLDGVVAQEANYRKSGFQLAHRNTRFQGKGPISAPYSTWVRPLEASDLEAVLEFDAGYFPGPRRAFTRAWLGMAGCHRLVSTESGGSIDGYGVLRPCRTGWKIGPLFARKPEVARPLLSRLVDLAGGEPTFLDVPGTNPAALKLVRDAGMSPVFETARMYTHGNPLPDCRGIFGITSFELG